MKSNICHFVVFEENDVHKEIIINKDYKHINPLYFGYQTCEKGHSYGPATRMYTLLHFVVSGKGIYRVGEREYHLSSGDMFVIEPMVETYYEADKNEPWQYIWIGFTGQPPLDLQETYHIPQALRIFEQMKASHRLQQGRTEFILGKLWELFSLLMEGAPQPRDPVESALSVIAAEYMTPLTISELAARLHLERTYFSALFHKRMGVSPKQYLLTYRMEQAAFLLRRGYSVGVTALSVGYGDVYTFSKMFKCHFGRAPTQYKKEMS